MSTLETSSKELSNLSNQETDMRKLSEQLKAGTSEVSQRIRKLAEVNIC